MALGGEIFAIVIMAASFGALIAFGDWLERNLTETLLEEARTPARNSGGEGGSDGPGLSETHTHNTGPRTGQEGL